MKIGKRKLTLVLTLVATGSVLIATPASAGLELEGKSLAGSVQITFGRHRDYYAPPPPPPPPHHHMHMPPPPPPQAHHFHNDYGSGSPAGRRDMWAQRPEPPRGYMPPPPPPARRYR